MEEEEALELLKSVLPDSVDDDTLEYMSGMIASEPPATATEFWELVGDFLLECEACADEEEGLAIGKKFCAASGADANDAATGSAEVVALSSAALEKLKENKAALKEQEEKARGFGDVYGGIGMTEAQLAARDEMDELPAQTLASVEVAARLKREKLARRDARRRWKAQEMTDHTHQLQQQLYLLWKVKYLNCNWLLLLLKKQHLLFLRNLQYGQLLNLLWFFHAFQPQQ